MVLNRTLPTVSVWIHPLSGNLGFMNIIQPDIKAGQRKIAHKANPNPDTIGVTLVPSPDCNPRFMFLLTSDRLACNLKSDRIATCDDFSKKKRTKKKTLALQIMHAKIEHG